MSDLYCKIDPQTLHQAVKAAGRPIRNQKTLQRIAPLLRNILLSVDGQRLSVVGTDLDVCITTWAELEEGPAGGSALIDYRTLNRLLNRLRSGSGPLELESRKASTRYSNPMNVLRIQSGAWEFEPISPDVDDYPYPEQLRSIPETACRLIFETRELRQALGQVLPWTSQDVTRPLLTAVHLVAHQGEPIATLESANGFVMARRRVQLVEGAPDSVNVNLSGRMLDLARHLSHPGQVILGIDEKYDYCDLGRTLLASQVIFGHYPDLNTVIPQTNIVATLDKANLAGVLSLVESLPGLEHPASLLLEPGHLAFSYSYDEGLFNALLPAEIEGLPAEGLEVGINTSYLRQAVAGCRTDQVRISFSRQQNERLEQGHFKPLKGRPTSFDPLTFQEVSADGQTEMDWICVLMPMHLGTGSRDGGYRND